MRSRTLLLSLALLCGGTAHAGPHDFVAYVTGMGGDPDTAKPYIDKFLAYVDGQMGWPPGSAHGTFVTTRKEALEAITRDKPGLGLVEPSLYFNIHKGLGAEPIVAVVSDDLNAPKLELVVKGDAYKGLADLKGKQMWTTLADEPAYLSGVVFDGKVDAAKHFSLKSVGVYTKAVRAVLRGEADATLLSPAQLAVAQKMEGGGDLKVVFTSPPLPPMPVVAFAKEEKAGEYKKLTQVLLAMCGTKGAEICKDMHITRFAPVNGAEFNAAQKRYDKAVAR